LESLSITNGESIYYVIISLSNYEIKLPDETKKLKSVNIRNWYWTSITILLILSAYNPKILGSYIWSVIFF
jgi:hypothetical protein